MNLIFSKPNQIMPKKMIRPISRIFRSLRLRVGLFDLYIRNGKIVISPNIAATPARLKPAMGNKNIKSENDSASIFWKINPPKMNKPKANPRTTRSAIIAEKSAKKNSPAITIPIIVRPNSI